MTIEHLETKAALTVTESGEITGVAWRFATPDRAGDVIEPKAFIGAPTQLPMLWSHDQSEVIGVWDSISASASGLQVKGRLLLDSVEKAREVRALVKAGAVNGLSIGFQTKKATPRKGGGRTISALDLVEVSIVAVPMHPDARITSAKSASSKGNSMENETIETKSADVIALEEKMAALEAKAADADKIVGRLDKIEARMNRPGAPAIITGANGDADLERKAFENYARHGVERMNPIEAKALSVGVSGAAGGYLVPPSWLTELQKNLVLTSPMRSVARIMTASVPVVTLPKRTANLSSAWVSETGARTESDPVYGQQNFTVYELAGYVDVSNQLLEDSMFNLEQELAKDIGVELGRAEGAAFVNGDGNGKPDGLLHSPAVGSIVNAAGATLAPDDLIDIYHQLPTFYAANAVWLMNRKTLGQIRKFKATTGEYLWAPGTGENGLVPGNPGTLLGKPVIEMPDFPDVAASTVSVVFGDMSNYRIFDRVGVELLRDPYTQRTTGQTRFHFRKRVGGGVSRAEGIRFLKTTA